MDLMYINNYNIFINSLSISFNFEFRLYVTILYLKYPSFILINSFRKNDWINYMQIIIN